MDRSVSSFVGFIPTDNPRLVILVVLDEPTGQSYGGLTAAPVFSNIAGQAMRYLKVMPTEKINRLVLEEVASIPAEPIAPVILASDASGRLITMPNFRGMSYRQVMQTMQQTGLNLKLQGTGRVMSQSPAAGQPIRFNTATWVRMAPPS